MHVCLRWDVGSGMWTRLRAVGGLGVHALPGADGEWAPPGTAPVSPAVREAGQHLPKFIGNTKSAGTSHSAHRQSCHWWDQAKLEEGPSGDPTQRQSPAPGKEEPLAAMQLEPTSTVGVSLA